jgi:hypothetical protein
VPWALDDGRIAASAGRGPGPDGGGAGARYEQVIVGGIGDGPITFLRPVADMPVADALVTDALVTDD